MDEIAYTASNDLLEKKQFATALKTVDKTLEFDLSNSKLPSFRIPSSSSKQIFENGEQ